jgi:hypothetical protein
MCKARRGNSTSERLQTNQPLGQNWETQGPHRPQQMIAELFQMTVPNSSMHIRNIYAEGELTPEATIKKFLTVRQEGNRAVPREAVIPENDDDVLKWFKPAKGDFQIHYSHDESYEPDFVVESKSGKYLCEPKRANELTDVIVRAKADAAVVWCEHATVHAKACGGKPWTYLLIPHDQISEQMTLSGMIASHTYRAGE